MSIWLASVAQIWPAHCRWRPDRRRPGSRDRADVEHFPRAPRSADQTRARGSVRRYSIIGDAPEHAAPGRGELLEFLAGNVDQQGQHRTADLMRVLDLPLEIGPIAGRPGNQEHHGLRPLDGRFRLAGKRHSRHRRTPIKPAGIALVLQADQSAPQERFFGHVGNAETDAVLEPASAQCAVAAARQQPVAKVRARNSGRLQSGRGVLLRAAEWPARHARASPGTNSRGRAAALRSVSAT